MCTNYNFYLTDLIFTPPTVLYKLCTPRDKSLFVIVAGIRLYLTYYLLTKLKTVKSVKSYSYIVCATTYLLYVQTLFLLLSLFKSVTLKPKLNLNYDSNIETRSVGDSLSKKTLMPEVITPQNLLKSMS